MEVLEPVVQYGFAGLAAVQLLIIVWMMKKFLEVFRDNQDVINANTRIISDVRDAIEDLRGDIRRIEKLDQDLRDKFMSRPCIAGRETPAGGVNV